MRALFASLLVLVALTTAVPVGGAAPSALDLYLEARSGRDRREISVPGDPAAKLRQVLRLRPDWRFLNVELAELCLVGGYRESSQREAARLLTEYLSAPADDPPTDPGTDRWAARLVVQHGSVRQFLEPKVALRAYEILGPDALAGWDLVGMASALEAAGRPADGIEVLRRVLEPAGVSPAVAAGAAGVWLSALPSTREKRALVEEWGRKAAASHTPALWVAALSGLASLKDAPRFDAMAQAALPDLAGSPTALTWLAPRCGGLGLRERQREALSLAWARHRDPEAAQSLAGLYCRTKERARFETLLQEARRAMADYWRLGLIREMEDAGWSDLARRERERAVLLHGDRDAAIGLLRDADAPARLRERLRLIAASPNLSPLSILSDAVGSLAGSKRPEDALALAEAGVAALGREPGLVASMGTSALALGRHRQAFDLLKEAMEADASGESASRASTLIAAARQAGCLPEAVPLIRRVLRLGTEGSSVAETAIRALADAGLGEDALALARESLARSPSEGITIALAELLVARKSTEELRRTLDEAARRYPGSARLLELRQRHGTPAARPDDELAAIAAYFDADREPRFWLDRTAEVFQAASLLHRKRDPEERQAWIRAHLGRDPVTATTVAAIIRVLSGETDAFTIVAQSYSADGRRLSRESAQVAALLETTGNAEAGALLRILDLLGGWESVTTPSGMAGVTAWVRLPDELAVGIAKAVARMVAADPKARGYSRIPGMVRGLLPFPGQPASPVCEQIAAVLATESGVGQALFPYADYLLATGRTPEALRALLAGAERLPTDPLVQREYGRRLAKLGQKDAALACYRRAEAHFSAMAYATARRDFLAEMIALFPTPEALAAETRAREERLPAAPTAADLLALVEWHLAAGDHAAAAARAEESLKQDAEPEDTLAAFRLLADADGGRALAWVERILALCVNDSLAGQATPALLQVALGAGTPAEGAAWMKQLAERRPDTRAAVLPYRLALHAVAGDWPAVDALLATDLRIADVYPQSVVLTALNHVRPRDHPVAALTLATRLLTQASAVNVVESVLRSGFSAVRADRSLAESEAGKGFRAALDARLAAADIETTRFLSGSVRSDLSGWGSDGSSGEAPVWPEWEEEFLMRCLARQLDLTRDPGKIAEMLRQMASLPDARRLSARRQPWMLSAAAVLEAGEKIDGAGLLRLLRGERFRPQPAPPADTEGGVRK